VLNVLILSAVAAVVLVGLVAPARAQTALTSAHSAEAGADMTMGMDMHLSPPPAADVALAAEPAAVRLDTQEQVLTAADRDLVVKVRLAGLWESPAGQMAMKKGVAPRVREIGRMIALQHVQLDRLVVAAAKELDVPLPNRPTSEQRRWLDEMADATGTQFDTIFVHRLRAAHGKIFPAIGVVRAGTENDTVRKLAQQANGFVLTHLTLLESTGLVRYDELPKPANPAVGPIAAASRRSADGGIAVPMIWMILGAALISGVVATARLVRPRGFGGRNNRRPRFTPDQQVAEPGPIPIRSEAEAEFLYPRPGQRVRSRPRALT
jgi:predicted outer membrane protein